MAIILTVMETHKGRISQAGLGALEVGRQVASSRGASLYAVLLLPSYDRMQQDLVAQLAACRADKVILVTGVAEPACLDTWVTPLVEVIDRFPPVLVLFGASPLAGEVAPYLCIHLKGIYLPNCTITVQPQLKITRGHPGTREKTEFFEEDLEYSVVALVHHGPRHPATGSGDVEVIAMLSGESPLLDLAVEPAGEIPYASDTLVVLGKYALTHRDALIQWCRQEEWMLVGFDDADQKVLPWWKNALQAVHKVLLIGCSSREFRLCESILSNEARWLSIGGDPIPEGIWIPHFRQVCGDLDSLVEELMEQEF